MTTDQTGAARRPTTSSIIAGVVVLLVVAAAGGALALLQPGRWSAESSFVVLPRAGLDTADSASYYETLSRGQVTATFAEIAANSYLRSRALEGLSTSVADDVTDEITVVPNTSVILVTATAPTPDVAESVSQRLAEAAMQNLKSIAQPYQLSAVGDGRGAAYRTGTSPLEVLVIAVVVGVVAAIVVQQAVYQLLLALRRRRRGPAATPAPFSPVEPVLAGRA